MPDPITVSAIASVAGTLSNSIAIATFIKAIKNTPTDVKTCFALTRRVSTDLEHLLSLRSQHVKYLDRNPFAANRLEGIISDAREAIRDISIVLEGCRKEIYEGECIPVKKRIGWVLGDGAAFERRRGNLQQVHGVVVAEMGWLRGMGSGREEEGKGDGRVDMEFENLELLCGGRRREGRQISCSREERKVEKVEAEVSDFGGDVDAEELDFGGDVEVESPVVKKKIVRKPVAISSGSFKKVIEHEDIEDEDPEVAFYKDLRRQEEERHKRIAEKKRLRLRNI
ncbi:hypothetical protein SBOR_5254 [Sclerotinia borealis F-4128]|uniref:Fungal N-terminal domain-containing protein n=1 Tax=Sclerotinia borealis (strain F-4128) TaxID=1432307 RepID=W9CIP6_SCLBF|nr:hypothetical protein SBOR_5254 [Sclerotinia borealis F-4128]